MLTTIEKIIKLIYLSDASAGERGRLARLLGRAKEEDLKVVLKLFLERPRWITLMSENYRMKRVAVNKNNKELLGEIIRIEELQLRNVAGTRF